jgi:hypothetical protein
LALLTGGGLAAAGGLLSGVLTNLLGAKRDQRKYEHEQAMGREARRQERLAQTYIELLTYLSHYGDWAKSVRPMWGSFPAPDPLPREERWRIEAFVTAYGSHEVNELLHAWGEHATKIDDADDLIRRVEQSRNPSPQLDEQAQREHLALRSYKDAMWQADVAIRERVSQELAGEA